MGGDEISDVAAAASLGSTCFIQTKESSSGEPARATQSQPPQAESLGSVALKDVCDNRERVRISHVYIEKRRVPEMFEKCFRDQDE